MIVDLRILAPTPGCRAYAGKRIPLPVAGLLVAALLVLFSSISAVASDDDSGELRLRGDVTVERDVVTIGDLIAGAPPLMSPGSQRSARRLWVKPAPSRRAAFSLPPISSAFRLQRLSGAAGFP